MPINATFIYVHSYSGMINLSSILMQEYPNQGTEKGDGPIISGFLIRISNGMAYIVRVTPSPSWKSLTSWRKPSVQRTWGGTMRRSRSIPWRLQKIHAILPSWNRWEISITTWEDTMKPSLHMEMLSRLTPATSSCSSRKGTPCGRSTAARMP
ncbi:MAG: hypothetical protein A4E42_01131 [Methanoregulaceae archaeon PtaU1.Bin222]|nr:MAG: hypothetical protein A4E42_01131 [Methanoregulaceae archaeon PtaU1.Bin222]